MNEDLTRQLLRRIAALERRLGIVETSEAGAAHSHSSYLNRDGSVALTGDWDIGDGRKLIADVVRARDAAGLRGEDDAGNLGWYVADGGVVAIGGTSTEGKLDVSGVGSTSALRLRPGTSTNTTIVDARNTLSNASAGVKNSILMGRTSEAARQVEFGYYAAATFGQAPAFFVDTAGTRRLFIDYRGYHGLGTTSPSYLLDVAGTARITDLLIADTGISFGDETLSTYDEGTFSARLMDSSGNTASVFSSNLGKYTQIGNVIIGSGKFQLSSGTSGLTAGDAARLTLPVAATSTTNYQAVGTVLCQTTGLTNYGYVILRISAGTNYANIYYLQTNAAGASVTVAQLANSNQTFEYSFMYHV